MQTHLAALRAFLLQLIPLTSEAWSDMEQRLQERTYRKGELFMQEGKVCKEIAYITQGSFRLFKMIDGIETTTYFSFEQEWISAYTSFLTQSPAYISIQAMEEATVLTLSYNDMQSLYAHHPVMERFGRLMAEHLCICLDERMHSLLLKTPEERYLKTLHDNSFYFERVPQHYIASYLGIAPESLSRIRRRVMKRVG